MAAFPSKWLFFKTYMPVVTGVGAIIDSPSSDQNYNSKWMQGHLHWGLI